MSSSTQTGSNASRGPAGSVPANATPLSWAAEKATYKRQMSYSSLIDGELQSALRAVRKLHQCATPAEGSTGDPLKGADWKLLATKMNAVLKRYGLTNGTGASEVTLQERVRQFDAAVSGGVLSGFISHHWGAKIRAVETALYKIVQLRSSGPNVDSGLDDPTEVEWEESLVAGTVEAIEEHHRLVQAVKDRVAPLDTSQ